MKERKESREKTQGGAPPKSNLAQPHLTRPQPGGAGGGRSQDLHDPSHFLLVVEDNVGDPDHLRRDPEGCDVVEIGRVPT